MKIRGKEFADGWFLCPSCNQLYHFETAKEATIERKEIEVKCPECAKRVWFLLEEDLKNENSMDKL
jgi:hypothetical protein